MLDLAQIDLNRTVLEKLLQRRLWKLHFMRFMTLVLRLRWGMRGGVSSQYGVRRVTGCRSPCMDSLLAYLTHYCLLPFVNCIFLYHLHCFKSLLSLRRPPVSPRSSVHPMLLWGASLTPGQRPPIFLAIPRCKASLNLHFSALGGLRKCEIGAAC